MSRVLDKENKITQKYKANSHKGIDLVGKGNTLANIIAHSHGEVISVRNDYKTKDSTGNSYGNYVKIKHDNGYYTLYAHMKYNSVTVKKGDKVETGTKIGYMGNTGHTTGAHLHFEVRDTSDTRIDPTPYIDSDLPNNSTENNTNNSSHFNKGDKVIVNGIGKSNSYGKGFSTGKMKNKKMYVMNYIEGRPYPYALSTNNKQVTGWFKAESVS